MATKFLINIPNSINMFRRIFGYLFLPLAILIGVGYVLVLANFPYVDQFVIASGPILAAFVALFIANNSDYRQARKEEQDRDLDLEHFISLLEETLPVIEKETLNYQEFIDDLVTKGFQQVGLKTTPFYYLNQISLKNKGQLFRAVLKNLKGDRAQLKQAFNKITAIVDSALFVKVNSREQYIRFIESFNTQAVNWRNEQLELNKLYGDMSTSPSPNSTFDSEFFRMIDHYNAGLHSGQIDFYQIDDQRNHLLIPMYRVLNQNFFEHPYVSRLQQILKIIEVSLNKMEEIQTMAKEHFNSLHGELKKISKDLTENLEHLKKMKTADNKA